ncbi:MAG: hypothetical protein IKY23_10425 [Lachnospiraceae bacterium]|nr:hypothetical protein [Lachnospiraceae bacterium]
MQNERFYNLVLIIFNQTFGIQKNKNAERYGAFPTLFPTYQLSRDLKDISLGKPLRDPSIYISAINEFFSPKNPECIEKTIVLIERLEAEGYLTGLEQTDIFTMCDTNTVDIYHKLLLDLWNFYYSQYPTNKITTKEVYSISQNMLDGIIKKYTEFQLGVSLKYYRQRIPEIIELLNTRGTDSLYDNIKTEYVYFFKKVLEDGSFYMLSREEKVIFINILYSISDILDKIHHKDSYKINLEILSFLNLIYDDNYNNIDIDDIRRIQGCVYAISIDTSDESLQGNMKLTSGKNIIRIESGCTPITQKIKLNMCSTALRNLLHHKVLHKLNEYFDEATDIPLYENRLQKNRPITADEIKELFVLSLVYSNIAACTLQYIKYKIDINTNYNNYVEICETYHERSGYIRNLIVQITWKLYGEETSEYNEALHSFANYYHSVATRYYYQQKYAESIAIRIVLYSFYLSLGLKEKANMQLDLAPINKFEQTGGNRQLFNITTRTYFEKRKKEFSYLSFKEPANYDTFRELVNEYHKYKNLFQHTK